jgi:hypothetical protein
MTSYSDAIRAGDVADFCELIWRKSVGDLAAPTVATREPSLKKSRPSGRVSTIAKLMATKLKSLGEQLEELPETDTSPLAGLRAPFPPNQVSKLPKETGVQAKQRKADQDAGKWPPKCDTCGGYHHPKAVHLDYVGHAALTDRLLDTDLEWSWEPVGFTPEGLPALDRNGGLWIKLTVCGVTRYGYGAADGKSGGDAMKEMIGDALRNAAMRFGAALDLWHKGDLHADDTPHNDATGEITITNSSSRNWRLCARRPASTPTASASASRSTQSPCFPPTSSTKPRRRWRTE